MNDDKSFSDKLMELTNLLQESDEEKQRQFAQLFGAAAKLAEGGFTQEQLQMIAITAYQCTTNPQLKQMYNLLMGNIKLDPNAKFH